MGQGVSD